MSNLSIIIPLHKYDDTYKGLLNRAVASTSNSNFDMDIAIVGPQEVLDKIEIEKTGVLAPIRKIANEDTNVCAQINAAANALKSTYISILEVDDEFTGIWLDNIERYMEENPTVSAFLPLTSVADFESGKFAGFANEAAWAKGGYDEPGFLCLGGLERYRNYGMGGALLRREEFIKAGGLKPSIKLFFWYEFLLRFVNKGKEIFVIPKVGYKHYINRPDSLSSIYDETMTPEEVEFWMTTASEEYFFDRDRNKTYEGE